MDGTAGHTLLSIWMQSETDSSCLSTARTPSQQQQQQQTASGSAKA